MAIPRVLCLGWNPDPGIVWAIKEILERKVKAENGIDGVEMNFIVPFGPALRNVASDAQIPSDVFTVTRAGHQAETAFFEPSQPSNLGLTFSFRNMIRS